MHKHGQEGRNGHRHLISHSWNQSAQGTGGWRGPLSRGPRPKRDGLQHHPPPGGLRAPLPPPLPALVTRTRLTHLSASLAFQESPLYDHRCPWLELPPVLSPQRPGQWLLGFPQILSQGPSPRGCCGVQLDRTGGVLGLSAVVEGAGSQEPADSVGHRLGRSLPGAPHQHQDVTASPQTLRLNRTEMIMRPI